MSRVVLELAIEPRPRQRQAEELLHKHLDVEILVGRGVVADPEEETDELEGHAPIFEQPRPTSQSPLFTSQETL